MSNDSDSTPVPSGEPPLSAGSDSAEAVSPPGEPRTAADPDPVPGDPDAGSRWALWRAAAARRFARSAAGEPRAALERRDPFESRAALRAWVADAVRGLLDIRFRREATLTLLPLAYLLGLVFACAVPIALTVSLWQLSAVLGVLAALVAVPLGLTIAAAVRLMLEFLVNAARLAGRVEHISDLADDLFQVLSDVAEPVNQLSEDVRAVQFWRFRRGSRK
ncbi:DUF4282 domain-containing protein [Nocardia harenae]|uniref:DUF4282 domain-containing protein n=1 Tax=Nocardia harenae TaxID=358707 RepID=UPI0009FBCC38|nr:DUF4282 domain-containing protein [Nocardia harenae]